MIREGVRLRGVGCAADARADGHDGTQAMGIHDLHFVILWCATKKEGYA